MKLSDLFPGGPALEFSGLSYDSRSVQAGDLFVAMPRVPLEKATGDHRDGHDFVAAAASAGAVAALVEHFVPASLPQVVVPSTRRALADVAATLYGRPAERLKLVGVTGTDGKTTTVQLASQVLEAAGHVTGFATTTDFKVADRRWENVSRQTTVEALEIQRLLREMVDRDCDSGVLEATSQGLEQERLRGCAFDVAAVTNVTRDHLDWHKTMEAYLTAKRRLFEQLKSSGVAVLNADDANADFFAAAAPGRVLTYGITAVADLVAREIKPLPAGQAFRLVHGSREMAVQLPLMARFNVYNALAAAGIALAFGLTLEQIAAGLESVRPAPGRMESIVAGQPFQVLVDYAHTPNSFEQVLLEARTMARGRGGRLLLVFGCSGERDRSKRAVMGRAAARLADFFVLTDEDPHSEDPAEIVREIEVGAQGGRYQVELDRRMAMAMAFGEARAMDVVLITGKGHERSMIVSADRKVEWDEREIVRQELRRVLAG
ncbi:MAG: UDP-N-acetylmuramoyl-L-alanyl-D-glutamate--2,6-diaminopimelate ligase [Chloroflexota bacterium]